MRPWLPRDLRGSPQRLSYIVVEEIIGEAIGLSVCAWPDVDGDGRLHFPRATTLVGVERAWLESELQAHRIPRELAGRELRVGDVYAAADVELAARSGETEELTIVAWTTPIYDLTSEARDAAKTALYGAVAPVLDSGEARELDELIDEGGD